MNVVLSQPQRKYHIVNNSHIYAQNVYVASKFSEKDTVVRILILDDC